MVAVPRGSGKARRQANPLRAWSADATQPEIQEGGGAPSPHLRVSLSQAIPMEGLGRRPGRNGLSAVSEPSGQGRWTLAWWLFLADRPFRLGHLEISFGICSKGQRYSLRAPISIGRKVICWVLANGVPTTFRALFEAVNDGGDVGPHHVRIS
jgi:hypothetical protein